jgi:Zn-dependent M28 family amino/carboxypeptidase
MHTKFAMIFLFILVLFHPNLYSADVPAPAKTAAERFNPEHVRADIQFLADDSLEGRGTGARGGDVAAAYIASQFEIAGLKPLGENGTFMQKVPLIGLDTQPSSTFKIVPSSGDAITLKYLDDYVANSPSLKEEETVDAPVVFVGYGVTAPEFKWNDYSESVKGKVVVILVNDPPSDDPKFFGGKAMTYYGRWTYKYEEAARQQAAAAIIIHNTERAAYGWQVVRNSWSSEQAYLENPPGKYTLPMAGWITEDIARKMFAAAGMNLEDMVKKAGTPGFHPVDMPLKIQAHLVAKVRPLHAQNVVGILEGSDPKLKAEAVLYSAHYDHLGIGTAVNGDNIYNGAVDNASGTGFLIELARVLANSPVRPKRSLIFLSVTAEERGLRGSEYFGMHPSIPTSQLMLDLNFDAIDVRGETDDISVSGAERTSLWPQVQALAKSLNLTISPDSHPEAGHYYRSDHFSLARVGVPSFSVDLGDGYRGKPKEYGESLYQDYLKNHYHQPSDQYDPSWELTGTKELAQFAIYLGWQVANDSAKTGWQPGDEFEKARK